MLDSSCDEVDGLKSSAGVAFRSMSLSLSSCHTNIRTQRPVRGPARGCSRKLRRTGVSESSCRFACAALGDATSEFWLLRALAVEASIIAAGSQVDVRSSQCEAVEAWDREHSGNHPIVVATTLVPTKSNGLWHPCRPGNRMHQCCSHR